MIARRGLTLLEVLLATALLALLAAMTTPVLIQARAAVEQERSPSIHVELNAIVDGVLADPETHGIADLKNLSSITFDWPESPDRSPIHISRLITADVTSEHAWLAFRWRDTLVLRHITKPTEEGTP